MSLTTKQANELADAFDNLGYAIKRERASDGGCACLFLIFMCLAAVACGIVLTYLVMEVL